LRPTVPFFSAPDVDGDAAIAELERRVAALCEVGVGVATHGGAAARFLALAAAGIRAGDEVLVPDLGGLGAAHAVALTGARPVLVDVEERTLGMDPAAAEAAVTPRSRAMLVAHVGGRAADLAALGALAARFGMTVIEDAGQALGSRAAGIPLGAHGHAGCLAFGADHLLAGAAGGMVVARSSRTELALRELAARHELGPCAAAAARTLADLPALPERLAHRRWLAERYRDGLAGNPRVHLPPLADGEVPLWIDVRVDGTRNGGRDGLAEAIAAAGYASRAMAAPAHTRAPFADEDRRFPAATRLAAGALWLPSGLTLGDADVARVVDAAWSWSRS
jgi:dTDP-4-amino-4,6-dideoxygalactose transaminase